MSASLPSTPEARDRLIDAIAPLVAPMGYEVVYLEVQTQRQKTLRVFIDFAEWSEDKTVGIEDCVKVAKALDEPLDTLPELEKIFKGTYELEVSSPGVDRPLRTLRDFERFSGRDARIHVYRPIQAEELENPAYQAKNPKQKNFLGKLLGLRNGKVLLFAGPDLEAKIDDAWTVTLPLQLISKANLEPKFDFSKSPDSEL